MKKIFSQIALAVGVILLMGACGDKTATTVEESETVCKVKVKQVYLQKVDQLYEYTAIVEANAVNNIAPLTGGRIEKIFVEVGDFVQEGQVLVKMEDNNLKQSKTQLDNLELTFKRLDELYKVGGVAKSDWDAAKTQLEVARTAYKNLQDNTQLVSPITGVISMRNYDSGDIYSGNPVLQVQQIVPVKMNINVSEHQFTQVKKGMAASVKMEVYKDEEFAGKVSLVYPTIDGTTHTFPVEVMLQNGNKKVRPGMYSRVTLNYGAIDHVVVPDVAIIKQQGSGDRYVYVCKDNKVYYKKVTLGRRLNDTYEVLSGVEDGDLVVIAGISKLKDGIEVEIVK